MGRGPLSVTQLNGYIKGVFEDELVLHNIAVYGEIFECSVSGTTTFLTLKDGDCVLPCVRYDSTVRPEIGRRVLLTGTVTFYAKGGRVSFVYRDLKSYGESELYAEFLRLKAALAAEGVFSGKPPLPALIRRVVVVTSPAGAVIHDFITVLKNRGAFCGVAVFPVRVQGEGAEREIAEAVQAVNASYPADAIVVARGGGANTDLAPFNTEIVARAVGGSRIPVISAVGHETDYTLCDFAASVRAATPSVAAAVVADTNDRIRARVTEAADNAGRAAARMLRLRSGRLASLSGRIEQAAERKVAAVRALVRGAAYRAGDGIRRQFSRRQTAVSNAVRRLNASAAVTITAAENALKLAATRTEAVNPLKILSAGYAKVYAGGVEADGTDSLHTGDEVRVRMKDGAFGARVDWIERTESVRKE